VIATIVTLAVMLAKPEPYKITPARLEPSAVKVYPKEGKPTVIKVYDSTGKGRIFVPYAIPKTAEEKYKPVIPMDKYEYIPADEFLEKYVHPSSRKDFMQPLEDIEKQIDEAKD
jgi:hypothetical protein